MGQDVKQDSHRDAIDKALGRLVEQAVAIGDRSRRVAVEMLGEEQPPTEQRLNEPPMPTAWLAEIHERIRNASRIIENANVNLVRIETDVVAQQPISTSPRTERAR